MKFRKTQKRVNNEWVFCLFEELEKGDVFRLFESEGEPVVTNNGSVFIAESKPYPIGVKGNYGIKATTLHILNKVGTRARR